MAVRESLSPPKGLTRDASDAGAAASYGRHVILAVALAGAILFIAAGLAWTARLVHIGNLDAQALAKKAARLGPGLARVSRACRAAAQPDEQSLVLLHVGWPDAPAQAATLLVALDRADRRSLSLLSQWCAAEASVSPVRRDGGELELRRRQSLERVHAVLIAEDIPAGP